MEWYFSLLGLFCGVIYVIAWSASFYPQVFLNKRRKTSVGISFDYLNFTMICFICYTVFTSSLYFSPEMKSDYQQRFNTTILPVDFSDFAFSLHATIILIVQCAQMFFYRKNQKFTLTGTIFTIIVWTTVTIIGILGVADVLEWLEFFFGLSWIVAIVAGVKIVPQLWTHYTNKSTEGLDIWAVLLDLTGASFSLCQLLFNVVNEETWIPFLNVGKIGLGVFSIIFDIIVVIQHYILYPPQKDKPEIEDLIGQEITEEENAVKSPKPSVYESNESSNPDLYKISYEKANNLFRDVN